MFCINFLCIILYVGQPVGENLKKRTPGGRRRGIFLRQRHGAPSLRAERGDSARGTGQRRVADGIRPLQLEEENLRKKQLSWIGTARPGRRYSPRTSDRHKEDRR